MTERQKEEKAKRLRDKRERAAAKAAEQRQRKAKGFDRMERRTGFDRSR